MDFETRAIHDGQEPDPATGAIITPIYQTSTFVQEAVGVHKGYDYARVANPTRTALQIALASLESAAHGVAFSSGLGATTTLMHLVNPGERVVLIADVYGGVYRMTSQVYEPKGYLFDYVPAAEFANLAEHLDEDTRIVWVETPSNPLLNVVDIRAAAEAAHAVGAILVVDNTFATPYLQNPLELGADVVVHSTTKYLGGHSDVVGGFCATNDPTIAERLHFLQKSLGAVPGPFDCWLVLRGIKTLAVRMQRHCENARAIADWLGRAARRRAGALPGPRDAPGPRDREAPDARLRRDDLLPRRVGGGGRRARRPDEALPARRVARRRREPDRAPGADDARLDRRRAVRRAAQPRPPLRRDRVGRRPDRRPRVRTRPRRRARQVTDCYLATPEQPIDLFHAGVARSVGAYLLDTSDGTVPLRLRADDVRARAEGGARGARATSSATSSTCSSRTSTSTMPARPGRSCASSRSCTVWVSEVGAPHLVDPSRLERSARRLYGDAFDELWGELAPVPERNVRIAAGRRRRARGLRRARARLAPRLLLRRHDAATRATRPACASSPSSSVLPPTPPPDVDVEAWYRTLEEIERRAPERLALIHFGPANDVSRHLGELRKRLDTWSRRVEEGASEEEFVAAARSDLAADEMDAYDRAMPFWQSYQGLKRYWETREA